MKYSELVESGATEAKGQDYLAEGAQTPVTLRVPKTSKMLLRKLRDFAA